MEKWNEICFKIKAHQEQNTREDFFEPAVVNIFEKLGWSQYREEISIREIIPIGASGRLIPDIIIKSNNIKHLVIELKRPIDSGSDRKAKQLTGYMLQTRLKFGLFIGRNLQFFYDDPSDNLDPIKLIEIEFTKDNEEGLRLIELLKKDSFSEEKLIEYCNEKLKVIEEEKVKGELITFLSSSEGGKYVLQLIAEDLKKREDNKMIDDLIKNILISIRSCVDINNPINASHQRKNDSVVSSPENIDCQENKESDEIEKIKRKIPIWLSKKKQSKIGARIFIAFMQLLGEKDFVSRNELKAICDNISTFDGHLGSMSQFGQNNHGKIFDIKRDDIRLWEPVASYVKEYYKQNYK